MAARPATFKQLPTFYISAPQYQTHAGTQNFSVDWRSRPRLKIFDQRSQRSRSRRREDNQGSKHRASQPAETMPKDPRVEQQVNKLLLKKIEQMQRQLDALNHTVGTNRETLSKEAETGTRIWKLERLLQAKDDEIRRYQNTIALLNEEADANNRKINALQLEIQRLDRCDRLLKNNQYLAQISSSPRTLDKIRINNHLGAPKSLEIVPQSVSSFVIQDRGNGLLPRQRSSPQRRVVSSFIANGLPAAAFKVPETVHFDHTSPLKGSHYLSPFNVPTQTYSRDFNLVKPGFLL